MNAICHRDLYEEGATIMVEVYDDRVEISNPGGLLPGVAEKFGHKSMSRNPLIFGLFTRMHLVEKVGSGIPRMRALMKEAGLPEPVFETKGFFSVTFRKRVKNYRSINDPLNDPLNSLSGMGKTVLDAVRHHPGIRRNHLSKLIGKSEATIKRALKTLTEFGLIEYRGAKKTGGYFVRET